MICKTNKTSRSSDYKTNSRNARTKRRKNQLRRRKPKRQGSRDQRGKLLPERQRFCRPYWNHLPNHRKDG